MIETSGIRPAIRRVHVGLQQLRLAAGDAEVLGLGEAELAGLAFCAAVPAAARLFADADCPLPLELLLAFALADADGLADVAGVAFALALVDGDGLAAGDGFVEAG